MRAITLEVPGTDCGSCGVEVEQALLGLRGVAHVDVRIQTGTVTVMFDGEIAAVGSIVGALAAAGYPVAGGLPPEHRS